MRLASVNIGRAKELVAGDPTTLTGIVKRPVMSVVHVGRLGLDGDTIVDGKHHGGPDQAVYVYGSEDYDWWAMGLGKYLEPGTFGENLTVDGLASGDLAVGDRLEIGDTVVLEATAPRAPCNTLVRRMGKPQMISFFRESGRPGLYCRVIAEGAVRMGDMVTVTPYAGERVTMFELLRDHFEKQGSEAALRRFLAAPLSERLRLKMGERLERLTEAAAG